MNVSLYQAASALSANERWQEAIAQNISASSVPGFKKQDISFSAVEAGLQGQASNSGTGAAKWVQPLATATTNFSQGELRASSKPTDMAIQGPGFFEVQRPDGTLAYTRDGEFSISPNGELITKSGFPLQGQGGPISIDRNNPNPITVTEQGDVVQGLDVRGRIKLMDFDNPALLVQTGGGLFSAMQAGLQATPATNSTIRSGYIEGANTSSMREMTDLIAVMRSSEANQRIIQVQDERLGKVISELGA